MKTECVFCHFDRYGKKRVLQDFYILILVRKHYAVAAFAAIAGYGVYANQKTDVMSDLALANIEALADGGEGSGDCYGCAIYAIGICKDWGWGGCKGQSLIHYV